MRDDIITLGLIFCVICVCAVCTLFSFVEKRWMLAAKTNVVCFCTYFLGTYWMLSMNHLGSNHIFTELANGSSRATTTMTTTTTTTMMTKKRLDDICTNKNLLLVFHGSLRFWDVYRKSHWMKFLRKSSIHQNDPIYLVDRRILQKSLSIYLYDFASFSLKKEIVSIFFSPNTNCPPKERIVEKKTMSTDDKLLIDRQWARIKFMCLRVGVLKCIKLRVWYALYRVCHLA